MRDVSPVVIGDSGRARFREVSEDSDEVDEVAEGTGLIAGVKQPNHVYRQNSDGTSIAGGKWFWLLAVMLALCPVYIIYIAIKRSQTAESSTPTPAPTPLPFLAPTPVPLQANTTVGNTGTPCPPRPDGHRRRSSVHMWTKDFKFDADPIDESCLRHLGMAACGLASSPYTRQAARLVRSVILSELTNLRTKTCSWTIWFVVDSNSAEYMNKSITAALKASDLLDTPASLRVVLIDAGFVPGNIHQFHICSNAVINLYHILPPSVEEYMYLAADELVVGDLDLIWDNAKQLGWDENHLLAAAEECVEPRGACGWYSSHSDVRFGDNGINFASCILSVKALHKYQFEKWVVDVAQNGSYNIHFGDQDLANLYGKLHPERMVLLQCNMNVRSDSGCDVEKKQPIVLHGNRQAFDTNSAWKAVALKVDEIFDSLSRDCGMHLVGSSVWEQIDVDVREGWKSSLSKPWGLSPQQSHSPGN